MQIDDNTELIQVPVEPEVYARRRNAAIKAGLDPDMSPSLGFVWIAAPKPLAPIIHEAGRTEKGLYRAAKTRELSDTEWDRLKDVLPDHPSATLSNRVYLNQLLRVVIEGVGWADIGHGRRWPAAREKTRRERERPDVWTKVLERTDTFDDLEFRAQLQRTCRYIRDGGMEELASTSRRRILSRLACERARDKREATIAQRLL